jgi:hypothetical protein
MITVCLLFVLSLLLGLKSRSINFTLAFTQAPIDEPTHLNLPIGFSVEATQMSILFNSSYFLLAYVSQLLVLVAT